MVCCYITCALWVNVLCSWINKLNSRDKVQEVGWSLVNCDWGKLWIIPRYLWCSQGEEAKWITCNLSTIKDWDQLHQISYIRDIFVLFLQGYCALQELLMKMNFTLAVALPFVYPMTSPLAMPTQSVQQYGFFSEHARWKQVVKGNFKIIVSLSFLVA